ncbi:MAG: hypothetical protein HQK83_07535 [Fibrobacteria bacterium]|nr:hypothetical protein [Fibrobacteria bacterium]
MRLFWILFLFILGNILFADIPWYYASEAENFDNNAGWVERTEVAGYQGEGYMLASTQSGKLDYKINFTEAGTYYLYLRNYATGSPDNAVHFWIDGNKLTGVLGLEAIYFIKSSTWNWSSQWQIADAVHEGPVDIQISSAGEHTLTFEERDDFWKFDRFVITTEMINPPGTYSSGLEEFELDILNDIPNGYKSDFDTTILFNWSGIQNNESQTFSTFKVLPGIHELSNIPEHYQGIDIRGRKSNSTNNSIRLYIPIQ